MHVVFVASEGGTIRQDWWIGRCGRCLATRPGEVKGIARRCFCRAIVERGRPDPRCVETGVTLQIPVGARVVEGHVRESRLPGSDVPVYLIDQPGYFDRDGLYGNGVKDYDDNCERFVFFDRAVLETIRALRLQPDVIHCNDWQTGLIPVYLQDALPEHARAVRLRDAADHPQPGLSRAFLALGHGADRAGLASLQLAAVRVPRQALLHEGRAGLRRHAQHGQPDLRPGDPDAEARLGAGGLASRPPGRLARDRQWDRHRGLESRTRADARRPL